MLLKITEKIIRENAFNKKKKIRDLTLVKRLPAFEQSGIRGTQRLFTVKYLFGESSIA